MVLGFPLSAPGQVPGWRALPLRVVAAVCALCAMAGVAEAGPYHPAPQTPASRTPASQASIPQVPAPQSEDRRLTHAVKAGYLYKFTPFIDWPDTAFESSVSPFRLCIAGHDPFGGVVDHAVRGARVGEHPVVVVRQRTVAKSPACHMLFVATSRNQTPREMLAMVAGQPVLTVADEGLDASGAMIQFVTIDSRVRFEIRVDAAQAAGLSVSSKLQALAAQPKEGSR